MRAAAYNRHTVVVLRHRAGRTYPIKPHWSETPKLHWASVFIAKLHRPDANSDWKCSCRSCELVRGEIARLSAGGAR